MPSLATRVASLILMGSVWCEQSLTDSSTSYEVPQNIGTGSIVSRVQVDSPRPSSLEGLSQELTIAPHPTFHWYLPQNNTHPVAQFVLYKVTRLDPVIEEVQVFSTQFQPTQQAGIASLMLPAAAMVPALEVGQDYRWQVQLLCLDQDEEYVVNQVAAGWITRVKPSRDLTDKLNRSNPVARIDILAAEGLWYDALTQLMALRRQNPRDKRLQQEWQTLFNAQDVQLSDIPPPMMTRP
jgi:hypothetical protein